MTDQTRLSCDFCGKNRNAVNKLIAGPSVYICNECIELSYQILKSEKNVVDQEFEQEKLPTPKQIKEFFDQYIISQDNAKEIISVGAYNHYKRIQNTSDVEIEKSNIMLVGPTGSGKTLFAKTLARILNVPFVIADATSLTESGYVGDDVESVVERLLAESDYDLERAQKGIIYIDEIDKKAKRFESSSSARDVSGEGVQQALLRLIEGSNIKLKIPNSKKYQEEVVDFNTDNVLFIVSGAFVGLDKVIDNRLSKNSSIGFSATVKKTSEKQDNFSEKITSQDIINYGIIPELMGRLPVICVLNKLTQEEMINVLSEVKNSLLAQYTELFKLDNIEIVFEKQYLIDCSKLASNENLGARGLRQIVENSLTSLMFRSPNLHELGVTKIIMNKYPTVTDLPQLVFEDGSTKPDTEYKTYRGINE